MGRGRGLWAPSDRSRLLGLGIRVQDFAVRVSGFEFRVVGFGFRVSSFGFRVSGFGFRVSGLKSRVSGFGGWIPGYRLTALVSSCAPSALAACFRVWGPVFRDEGLSFGV